MGMTSAVRLRPDGVAETCSVRPDRRAMKPSTVGQPVRAAYSTLTASNASSGQRSGSAMPAVTEAASAVASAVQPRTGTTKAARRSQPGAARSVLTWHRLAAAWSI